MKYYSIHQPVAANTQKNGYILKAGNSILQKFSTATGDLEWEISGLAVHQIILESDTKAWLLLNNKTVQEFDVANNQVLRSAYFPTLGDIVAPQNAALLDKQGNLVIGTSYNVHIVDTKTLEMEDLQPAKLAYSTYGIAIGSDGGIYRPNSVSQMEKIGLTSPTNAPTQSPTQSPTKSPTPALGGEERPGKASRSSVPSVLLSSSCLALIFQALLVIFH